MTNPYWIILAIKSRSFSQEVYLPFNGPTPNSGMFTVYKMVLIFHPCELLSRLKEKYLLVFQKDNHEIS